MYVCDILYITISEAPLASCPTAAGKTSRPSWRWTWDWFGPQDRKKCGKTMETHGHSKNMIWTSEMVDFQGFSTAMLVYWKLTQLNVWQSNSLPWNSWKVSMFDWQIIQNWIFKWLLNIILCLFKTHIIDKILNGILSILGNYHPPQVHNSTLRIFFHFWRKVVFQLLTHGRVYVRMVSVLCLPYFWQTNIAMGKAPFFGGKSFINGSFQKLC